MKEKKKFPRSKFKESLIKNKSITDKETQPKLISLGSILYSQTYLQV